MNFDFILNQPAFVIHIEELSPERKDFFTENIKNAGFKDMRIFKGVMAKDNKVLRDTIEEFNNINFHKDMSLGAIGCLLSHLKIYKHIIQNKIQVCTIFEDDVHFHPNWSELAFKYYENTPKNFDLIFMGNQIDECITTPKKVQAINNCSAFCLHAYIITYQGAQKLLKYLLHWDYNTPDSEKYVGHPLTGLFAIDIMIKNIQDRMNKKKLKKTIYWYCWNGTNFKCKYNSPIKVNINSRNTGLVFQSDNFISTTI